MRKKLKEIEIDKKIIKEKKKAGMDEKTYVNHL